MTDQEKLFQRLDNLVSELESLVSQWKNERSHWREGKELIKKALLAAEHHDPEADALVLEALKELG